MARKIDDGTDVWLDENPGNTGGGGNFVENDPFWDAGGNDPVDPAPAPTPNPNPAPPPGTNGANYPGLPNPNDYPAPGLPNAVPPPDPLRPWEGRFTAPTADEAASQPGFQFQLGQGLQALQRGAASKGTLLTGGAQKGLEAFAVDSANSNYKDVYAQAADTYDRNRTDFLTNEANRYSSQYQNWSGQFGQNQTLFGDANTNRMNSWGISSDYFNQGQAQRLNDMNSFNKLLQLANLTRPVAPSYSAGN